MMSSLRIRSRTLWNQTALNQLTWKHILASALLLHICKYVLVLSYCSLAHLTFHGWTRCWANDRLYPKFFPNTSAISPSSSASEVKPCDGSESILVYVPSTYYQWERRRLIRDTWAKDLLTSVDFKVKFVFVLGVASESERTSDDQQQLQRELAQHDDMLTFDIVDHYYNLTLKTRAIYAWTLRNCPRIDFLIRADTDIVLNSRRLFQFVNYHSNEIVGGVGRSTKKSDPPIVFGQCRAYDCVTRLPWSKSCLPTGFYTRTGRPWFYPGYCLGFSSIVSIGFVGKAVESWRRRSSDGRRSGIVASDDPYLPMEDLHTLGYTSLEIGAWRVGHRKLFVYDQYFDSYSCQLDRGGAIASAAYDDDSLMREKWAKYRARCDRD